MKKILLSLAVISILLLGQANAAEERAVIDSGTCGENVTWTLYDDGELHISGAGAMADYSSSGAPWCKDYWSKVKAVVIDEGIISVGAYAFYQCNQIASVKLPKSVTSIGCYAFCGCGKVTEIIIPESVTLINAGAFQSTGLISAIIPDKVTTIDKEAFKSCSKLTDITIPQSVTSIGDSAFSFCSELTEITIPGSVTSIGESAFSFCSKLTSVTLSEGVTSIGRSAFSLCERLTGIAIPDSVTNIGSRAFWNSAMRSIAFSGSVKAIEEGIVEFCEDFQDVLFIGRERDKQKISIDSTNNAVFLNAQWHYLSSWDEVFSSTVDQHISISPSVYIAGMTITVMEMPEPGFFLKTVLVDGCPIKGNTFSASGKHVISAEFNSHKTTPIVASGRIVGNNKLVWAFYSDGELYISGFGAMKGKSDVLPPWRKDYREQITSVVIENHVTSIMDDAFLGCNALSNVTIPNSVTRIGDQAFYSCDSLAGVTIPEGVTSIGTSAFAYSGLTGIIIPSSVTSIGDQAFYLCSSLISATLSEGVTTIGNSAFQYSGMTSIIIPSSVTSIGKNAFSYGLKDIFYLGSAEQWGLIAVASPNDNIKGVAIHHITGVSEGVFAIHFEANGGEGAVADDILLVDGVVVTYRLPVCRLMPPIGKRFRAWSVDDVEYVPGEEITVTKNTVITATWKDCEHEETKTLAEEKILSLEDCGNAGLKELTYICDICGFPITFQEEVPATGNHAYGSVVAITEPNGKVAGKGVRTCSVCGKIETCAFYRIRYRANGGSGSMENLVVVEGEAFTLPECAFQAPGNKLFYTWSMNGGQYAPGTQYQVDQNTVFTALWREPIGSYHIILDGPYHETGSNPNISFGYFVKFNEPNETLKYVVSYYYILDEQDNIMGQKEFAEWSSETELGGFTPPKPGKYAIEYALTRYTESIKYINGKMESVKIPNMSSGSMLYRKEIVVTKQTLSPPSDGTEQHPLIITDNNNGIIQYQVNPGVLSEGGWVSFVSYSQNGSVLDSKMVHIPYFGIKLKDGLAETLDFDPNGSYKVFLIDDKTYEPLAKCIEGRWTPESEEH